jgi:hypothetical protein
MFGPTQTKDYTVTDTLNKYFNICKGENVEIQSKWFYKWLGIAEQGTHVHSTR